jgi:RimJ/RimL family protein N-acetyltransferase
MEIYLRPLSEKDALKSFHWRNDPDIWRYTGSRPSCLITQEIELEWIRHVLKKEDLSVRFAICVTSNDEYIGNVQLTGIKDLKANFEIFIGNKQYWGFGIASKATAIILDYAGNNLNLNEILIEVNKNNIAAIRVYEKNGFSIISSNGDNHIMKVILGESAC